MFDHSRFNQASFNLAGNETPSFYATITSRYSEEIGPLRIRVRIGAVSLNAESALNVGNLGLYTHLPEMVLAGEFAVLPNFTALIPLGPVRMEVQSEVSIFMGAKIPLGGITLAAAFMIHPTMGVTVSLAGITHRSEFEVRPRFGVLVPAVPVAAGSEFEVAGGLWAKIPLRGTAVTSEFELQLKSVRTAESEEMVLEGLNLQPGQTLIIDTDTLEIYVDDQPRVDCWVTGGSFFQFKNGDNVLSFSDNANRRNLQVTVIWSDRYL